MGEQLRSRGQVWLCVDDLVLHATQSAIHVILIALWKDAPGRALFPPAVTFLSVATTAPVLRAF